MRRAHDLYRYWRRHPPLHKLAAAFMGYKAPAEAPQSVENKNDPSGIGGLISQFPNGFVKHD